MAVPPEERYTEEEYYAMTAGERWTELIDGIIVDMSPSPNQRHQWIQGEFYADIRRFIRSQKGKCKPFMTSDVKLVTGTIVIPDIYVTCHPEKLDGQRHWGAPDWVIEIVSPGYASKDYVTKAGLYKDYGAREYWVVDPQTENVSVFIWDGGQDECRHYSFEDKIPVYIFRDKTPQLEICIEEYLEED
ncbi:MAG: Uma2 family endonuclease [Ruminococcus sp.]|nr:Uma2 family endonuclease [Ruminococcus sp.]